VSLGPDQLLTVTGKAAQWRYSKSSQVVVTFSLNTGASTKARSLFGKCYYLNLMLSLMPFYLLSVCILYAFCLLKVVFAALDAPIGYEDGKGFHYGMKTATVPSEEV